MLEKPDLPHEKIIACLHDRFGLHVAQVTFLPLGADQDTAVYHVMAKGDTAYFLKLRSSDFDETSVLIPKFLADRGIEQIIAPLITKTGQLWARLDAYKVVLYPFVEGHNGYEVDMSERHWHDFGATLKRIHTVEIPPALLNCIRKETFSPRWRATVKTFLARIEHDIVDDPIARTMAACLKLKRSQILDLVGRAERLAQALQARSSDFIMCHSDIHAGNIFIDTNGAFYIVDWDTLTLAPKERDLMYIGGGLLASGLTPQEEESCFYESYGQTALDPIALAYYRYERIVEDIAVYCEQLFLSENGGEDRARSLHYLKSNFLPNSTIEIAYQSDQTL